MSGKKRKASSPAVATRGSTKRNSLPSLLALAGASPAPTAAVLPFRPTPPPSPTRTGPPSPTGIVPPPTSSTASSLTSAVPVAPAPPLSAAPTVIQQVPHMSMYQIVNIATLKDDAEKTRAKVQAQAANNSTAVFKNVALVAKHLHGIIPDILENSSKLGSIHGSLTLTEHNWQDWPTNLWLDELCLLASNQDSLSSSSVQGEDQKLSALLTSKNLNLEMKTPDRSKILKWKTDLNLLLNRWGGDTSLVLGDATTQASIKEHQSEIVRLLIKNCISKTKAISSRLQSEMEAKEKAGFIKTVDDLMKEIRSTHDPYWKACTLLKGVFDKVVWANVMVAMNGSGSGNQPVPTPDKPSNSFKPKGNGNSKGHGDKDNYQSKSSGLCNICGGNHSGACIFITHPNANHEKIPFRDSTAGKAYLSTFASKKYDKLKTDIIGKEEKFKIPKSGTIISNNHNDNNNLCNNCTTCKSLSLNHINIPIDNDSNDHLLLSYIKVNRADESLLIKAFLDSGSLQDDGNYINQNLFNRLRLNNNIIIVNKKSKSCNQILNACISTNIEIQVLWYFYNNLTNAMESINLTCKVVRSPYDLIIGRNCILQHQLIAKCHEHFQIDMRLFRNLTNFGRGEEHNYHQIPVNYLNLIDSDAQNAFPSTIAELPGFRQEGRILKKSELLSANPSLEDNIEFISEDLPHINDTITDETELISFEFKGEDEHFNAEALKIFKRFKDVISTSLRTQPAKIEPMKIVVDDSKWKVNANRTPPRMISREKEAAMIKQIEDYLTQHVVEPSVAPYWSQVLMTPKPHVDKDTPPEKRFRFCVDQRNLNKASESSGGHIPNIKFMIQRIGLKRPKYFCKIDLTTGFFQAPLSKDSREYTTFTSSRGNFQFLRVPMGCKNSPAYFQNQLANTVLPGLLYQICELYIDDVLIFGNTPTELLHNLVKVLERFQKHNIIANPKKIRIGMSEIEHTGYLLNQNGFTFSREKLDMVEDFDRPVLVKDLKSFLGLANHFRSVVQNHSLSAVPLDKLCANYETTRYNKIKWTDETIASFNELKSKIVNCPSMYFLQDNLPIFLATDASKYLGYGAYLYQKDPNTNQEFPVAFISKSWQGAQVNWSTPDQEAFAIYDAFKRLHYLIRDVKFTLLTDHANLTYVNFEGSDKIQRYKAEMLQYDFDIQHIKGKDNLVPDILSRMRREPQVIHQLNLLEGESNSSGDDLILTTNSSDQTIPVPFHEDINEDIHDDDNWFDQSKSFPLKAQRQLRQAHGVLSGHGGVEITYTRLMSTDPQYWAKNKHLVKRFVRRCYFCQKMSMIKHQIHSSPFTTSSQKLFEKVCMDYIGPLPPDGEGNRYILVVIDSFSRYLNLYASQSNTANECALALLDYTSTFGNPTVLFSDRGTHFVNSVIAELTKLVGSSQQFTAPYSSEENGLCERVNKEVLRHLRGIIFDKAFKYDWGRADLPLVKRIINNLPHSRLGVTPNSLVLPSVDLNKNMFGHRRAASDVSNIPIPKHSKSLRHSQEADAQQFDFKYFLEHMQNRQEVIHQLVRDRIQQFDEERIGNYPADRTEFPIGSYVLLRPKSDAKFGIADKLHTPLKGPYQVVGHDKNTYQIRNLTTNKMVPPVNIQRLQPFYVNEIEDDPKVIANKDSDSFIIERVISHAPAKPTRVTELCFRIKWLGWDDEDSNTTECWLGNPDLKINKVVLRYMNSIPHLKKFVNKNIHLDSDDEDE